MLEQLNITRKDCKKISINDAKNGDYMSRYGTYIMEERSGTYHDPIDNFDKIQFDNTIESWRFDHKNKIWIIKDKDTLKILMQRRRADDFSANSLKVEIYRPKDNIC
jgi:hypothetical protein